MRRDITTIGMAESLIVSMKLANPHYTYSVVYVGMGFHGIYVNPGHDAYPHTVIINHADHAVWCEVQTAIVEIPA